MRGFLVGVTAAVGLVAGPLGTSHASTVVASVGSSWSYNAGTQRYTYSYAVTNAANSPHHLETFVIRPAQRPISMVAPAGWMAVRGWQGDTTAVAWTVINSGPPPVNWNMQPYVGPNHIAPGATKTGFQVVSDHAPDSTAVFVASGFDTIPEGAHTFGGARPPKNPTLWQEGWTGSAIVPAFGGVVGAPSRGIEGEFRFYPPTPNPTRGSVVLTFVVPRAGDVELRMFDVAGRRIATPVNASVPPGRNQATWDGLDSSGRKVAAGMYFYQLVFDGKPVGERHVVVMP